MWEEGATMHNFTRKEFLAGIVTIFFTGCAFASLPFKLQSPDFQEGKSIPTKYTCEGQNVSPALHWQAAPQDTQSFVLIVDDPDAPSGDWTHWIVFNLSKTTHDLAENITTLPNGADSGKNSWGKSGYDGPCPPTGEHRYFFKLYAVDKVLNLPPQASQAQIKSAIQGHVLAETILMGRYKKLH